MLSDIWEIVNNQGLSMEKSCAMFDQLVQSISYHLDNQVRNDNNSTQEGKKLRETIDRLKNATPSKPGDGRDAIF